MPYSDFASPMPGRNSHHETDAQLLQAAHHLVDIFLVYLREHDTGSDLFDTEELPAAKEGLINAFRVVIATESRPGVRALLIKAGMALAQFQENIGPRMSVRSVERQNTGATHNRYCREAPRHPGDGALRRFDRALMRLGEDRTRLVQVFKQAADIAEDKPVHHA